MTAMLFTSPVLRPLTISGAIMPDAYVQFYLAGTTTPADVYADAALTTPLENPVVANSAGEFPPIYLDRAVAYRAQLYAADDVLQWDIDPLGTALDYAPGTVVMFFGDEEARDEAYPPALWQVCDGSNGSPDLRSRFPMGMDSGLTPGDTGGASGSLETSEAGAHDHTGSVSSESLSVAQMPTHRHQLLGTTGGGITDTGISASNARGIGAVRNNTSGPYVDQTSEGEEYVEDVGDGDPHDHDITEDGAHTHTVSVTAPYCVLWFLVRKEA